jgi:hypothetical protein
MSGIHGFGELTSNYMMVAGLTGFMHIDQQILIVEGDLDQISYIEIRQSLIFSHVHGKIPRLKLPDIDDCLVASNVPDRAKNHPVPGEQLRLERLDLRGGASDGGD